ncbi:acyltransferase [Methylosinus sp. Sm6]|uniref:acyltransferase family protein n=1 Tax=Methylosinus sp. Sm6 TaxID=2866948 RepID=UPI001DB26353|nr:acyltransferase [Methylosinus sp. Sm6]MBY6242669.1 acyltransferase [Methylosinus sp. Sm6]
MRCGDATERNDSLDVARGLAMILVIYGHVLQIFFHARADGEFSQMAFLQWQAIYSFHMPLFFLISGAILDQFSGKSWKDVATRSAYLIALAYIVDVIGIFFAAVTQGVSSETIPTLENYVVDHLLLAESFSTITPWFLVAFAIVRLLAYALTRCDGAKRWLIGAALAIVFAASYRYPQAFHLRAVPPGVAFFMVGRYLSAHKIDIGAWAAIALLATALWLAHSNGGCTFAWQITCENAELPGRFAVLMIFGLFGSLPLFFLTAAMGAAGIMGLSGPLGCIWIARPVRFIGRNSLDFLLINGFYLVFGNPYLRNHVGIDDSLVFFVAVALLATLVHVATFLLLKRALFHIKAFAQGVGRFATGAVWNAVERMRGAPTAAT